MKAHSNVQLAVPCLLVRFQSLLPTNETLHAPTLPAVFQTTQSTIDNQRFKLQTLTASCREAVVYGRFNRTLCEGVCFSLVPFESTGIRLQNMRKLSVYTKQGLRSNIQKPCICHVVRKISTNEARIGISLSLDEERVQKQKPSCCVPGCGMVLTVPVCLPPIQSPLDCLSIVANV